MRPSRFIKIGLIAVGIALICIISVWMLLMFVLSDTPVPLPILDERVTTPSEENQANTEEVSVGSSTDKEIPIALPEEGITIDTSGLTDTQKSMLATFGFTGERIYFSATAVTCAYEALGTERFMEIVGGALPGPLEAAKLYQCTNE